MKDEMKPWLRPMVTEFLESVILRSGMAVFEWGMGNSTIWMSHRVRHVISVEHDKDWFSKIPGRKNIKRILIQPQRGIIGADPSDPKAYFSDDKHWRDHNFRRYASVIDDLGPFDVIFVDGRARPSCLVHGHRRLKPGGFLVLDDANREYYLRHTAHLFRGWDRAVFFEKKKKTAVWRKPLRMTCPK